MATQALDLATIGFALHVIEEQHLGDCAWRSGNSEQERFLEWYRRNRGTLTALDGLHALASKEYTGHSTRSSPSVASRRNLSPWACKSRHDNTMNQCGVAAATMR